MMHVNVTSEQGFRSMLVYGNQRLDVKEGVRITYTTTSGVNSTFGQRSSTKSYSVIHTKPIGGSISPIHWGVHSYCKKQGSAIFLKMNQRSPTLCGEWKNEIVVSEISFLLTQKLIITMWTAPVKDRSPQCGNTGWWHLLAILRHFLFDGTISRSHPSFSFPWGSGLATLFAFLGSVQKPGLSIRLSKHGESLELEATGSRCKLLSSSWHVMDSLHVA